MANIAEVSYSYHVNLESEELVSESLTMSNYEDACKLIDDYPWQLEVEYLEIHGEGQGIYFAFQGAEKIEIVISPDDEKHGFVMIDIVLDSGFLGLFGRKAVSKSFNMMSYADIKLLLRDFFTLNKDQLYQKYSDKASIVQ